MGTRPIGYVTRTEKFSACHRLNSEQLTSEQNFNIYGKCNNPNGHGHNYTVEVTLKGPISENTGMIENISNLKEWIQLAVMDVLDHKNLNMDVSYFKNVVTTTENVAVFIWNNLLNHITGPASLYEVKVYETDKNSVSYRGE